MVMRRFTKEELARYDGQDNRPAFIACYGMVYDVSPSFLWQNGKHQVVHFAGTDLTNALAQAPHGSELIDRFPCVGVLIEEEHGAASGLASR
ncbi:MAG: cytochrome b5 domain-containing protein, partial [Anaerolineaceae bacterium]|nr:cytochrome b5 domain-containing protein [Anaerolineaceae bacterium]